MHVTQLMVRPVYWCCPDDDMNVPARLMWENDCGCVPVCVADDDGTARVVGMLTDRDIAMAAYTQGRSLGEISVRSAMSHDVVACRPNDPIPQALVIMQNRRLHRLPVVEAEDRLVGMLSLSDVARAVDDTLRPVVGEKTIGAESIGRVLQAIRALRQSHDLTVAA